MLKKQSASEVARGVAPSIIVKTASDERVLRPERDDEMFSRAALAALQDAHANGFGSVVFGTVLEFVVPHYEANRVRFIYSWEFTAHSPLGATN